MLEFEIERTFDEALASAKAKLRDDPLVRRWRWKYRVIFPLAAALIPLIRSVVVEDTAEAQLRWAAQVIGVAILVSFWVSSEYRSVEKWRTFLVGSLGPWPRTEIIPPPNETTHQDLIGGTGPKAVESQKRVIS